MDNNIYIPEGIIKTPWDSVIFNIPTYEIKIPSETNLRWANSNRGHYTLKVDGLYPRGYLEKFGFYHTDTMLEPWVTRDKFLPAEIINHATIRLVQNMNTEIREIATTSFFYDRYHKDSNLPPHLSSARYGVWIEDIINKNGYLYSLEYFEHTIGFFAGNKNKIILHAISRKHQGKKLSGVFWTLCCSDLFKKGHTELCSSISAANLAVLNLYASLGFKFRNIKEVYHCSTKP